MHLRDQEVWFESADEVRIDVIQRLAGFEPPPHLGVDFAAGDGDVERGSGAGWQRSHPRGVVALMGATHECVTSPEGTDDLSPAGQQGHDSHDSTRGDRQTPVFPQGCERGLQQGEAAEQRDREARVSEHAIAEERNRGRVAGGQAGPIRWVERA